MVQPNRNHSSRERFNISRLAISAPWLTISFWIAVTVAGIMAFSSLKYALFPDIAFPVVVVNASAPLTTALDTERELTQQIEQTLRSLKGLDDIQSSTYPSQSAVSVSFKVGTSLEESARDVETAMKAVTLPKNGTFKVIALNLNESAAVSYVIDSSSRSLADLTTVANEQIVPAIAKLPGVLKVSLLGTGGQTPSANPTPQAGQLGTLVRFNGADALAFQVIKRGDANTLEVVSAVEKEVARLRTLPDLKLTVAATQAEYIQKATRSTIDALIEAIVLAVIVIFPFLRSWSATLISALAIPISLLGTFIVMAIFGFNLETITLLALALVIGSVVDDAIVDVENISRHIDNGESPKQAALHATDEIGLPVTAATLTAVAVFLPIGLMGGVIGQFFKPFGITVAASMLISLLVARTLSPVLSIYMLRAKKVGTPPRTGAIWVRFSAAYGRLLAWSLRHRAIVTGIAVLSFVAGIALIPLIP
ncbi:MAG: efflux RND transporter permease subunit, partial [Phormidesmis sp. CAN_BIN44]|nr:efflux RND transporter permease subunit [Phormidesmis sp. CAN_BIN44]